MQAHLAGDESHRNAIDIKLKSAARNNYNSKNNYNKIQNDNNIKTTQNGKNKKTTNNSSSTRYGKSNENEKSSKFFCALYYNCINLSSGFIP